MDAKDLSTNTCNRLNDSTEQCTKKQLQPLQTNAKPKQRYSSEDPFFSIGLREYFQYEMPLDTDHTYSQRLPDPGVYKNKDRPVDDSDENSENFRCTDCSSSYNSQSNLRRHLTSKKHQDAVTRNAKLKEKLHILPVNDFDERNRSLPTTKKIPPFQQTKEFQGTHTYRGFQQLYQFNQQFAEF